VDGERTAGDLVARSGLSQSALSQHLAKLRAEGLVATRREAQAIFYRLDDPKAARLLGVLHEIYCRRKA
jgi:DNA-binding transcriptional ArsR family regulator